MLMLGMSLPMILPLPAAFTPRSNLIEAKLSSRHLLTAQLSISSGCQEVQRDVVEQTAVTVRCSTQRDGRRLHDLSHTR